MSTSRRLLPLFLATAALLGVRATSHAQTVSPVPAPTIITSAPYTITESGYYQLGTNINYNGNGSANEAIITINASNVTLDFAGHYIAGPTTNTSTQLFGIYASERSNLLIQNGTIAYCYAGVVMVGNKTATTNFLNPRVLNMVATKCYYIGIDLVGAISPVVADCRISSSGGSTVSKDAFGMAVEDSSGAKVSNDTLNNIAASSNGIAYGIEGGGSVLVATGNQISNVTSPSGGAFGLLNGSLAIGNTIINVQYGVVGYTKYKDNLTSGCAFSFSGGTNVGVNN